MNRPPTSNVLGLLAAAAVLVTVTAAGAVEPAMDKGPLPPPGVGGVTAATASALNPAPATKKRIAQAPAPSFDKAVTVDLPPGDDVYPDMPGALVVDRNCLSCHSPEVVVNQPSLSRAQWTAVIAKMRDAYKAPIADDDAERIADYLVSLRGEARTKWR